MEMNLKYKSLRNFFNKEELAIIERSLFNNESAHFKIMKVELNLSRDEMAKFRDKYLFGLSAPLDPVLKAEDNYLSKQKIDVVKENLEATLRTFNPLELATVDFYLRQPKYRDGVALYRGDQLLYVSRYIWSDYKKQFLYPSLPSNNPGAISKAFGFIRNLLGI